MRISSILNTSLVLQICELACLPPCYRVLPILVSVLPALGLHNMPLGVAPVLRLVVMLSPTRRLSSLFSKHCLQLVTISNTFITLVHIGVSNYMTLHTFVTSHLVYVVVYLQILTFAFSISHFAFSFPHFASSLPHFASSLPHFAFSLSHFASSLPHFLFTHLYVSLSYLHIHVCSLSHPSTIHPLYQDFLRDGVQWI